MSKVRSSADWPRGKVIRLAHQSKVLETNPWDDPVDRDLTVYLPPGYDESGTPYSTLWDLAAFTNSGPGHVNWRHRGESLPQRLDRLIGSGELPAVVVPMPDCFTSLGGNQYLNSPAVGRYADYLAEELIPFLAQRVNVKDTSASRGAFGKSSGGYGALVLAMVCPGVWAGVASHAADMGFEWVYRPAFPVACRVLEKYGNDPRAFLAAFWKRRKVGGDDYSTLMTLAMAATYDPDAADPTSIRLPFKYRTSELITDRWQQWLAWDPINLVELKAAALRELRLLYFDVGCHDEYHIQFGARAFADRLEEYDIDHHFEEFEGSHRDLDWRLDISLPKLAAALVE